MAASQTLVTSTEMEQLQGPIKIHRTSHKFKKRKHESSQKWIYKSFLSLLKEFQM